MTGFLIILAAVTAAAGVRRARMAAAKNRASIPEARAQQIAADPSTATGDVSTAAAPTWSHTFDEFGPVTITTYEQWMQFMDDKVAGAGADGMTEGDGAAITELMMWGNETFRAWERM